MKVVIYSTNTNSFNPALIHINSLPECAENLTLYTKKNLSLEIIVATQLPGTFLTDFDSQGNIRKAKNVSYKILQGSTVEELTQEILELNPDLAVAATYWVTPFDWLQVQDALIAELLESKGIKTLCHSTETAMVFFDKWRTHQKLKNMGMNVARAVYVHHELFWAERGKPGVKNNAYKELVLHQMEKLNFPVVIKDTLGLSSYGMDVCKTSNQAKAFLLSKKNSGDRLVEEFLEGPQFGTEIHGTPGHYTIFPPFMFSTNQYGITSPKQSVKLGPVTCSKYKIDELKEQLTAMAERLELKGIAQVDLVFHKEKWYIIEINPRLSGMTQTVAASTGKTAVQLLMDAALEKKELSPETKLVFDIKFPILTQEQQKALFALDSVIYLQQTFNEAANQHREMGFCEVIFGARENLSQLRQDLEDIKNRFPEIMEPVFYENAIRMMDSLES